MTKRKRNWPECCSLGNKFLQNPSLKFTIRLRRNNVAESFPSNKTKNFKILDILVYWLKQFFVFFLFLWLVLVQPEPPGPVIIVYIRLIVPTHVHSFSSTTTTVSPLRKTPINVSYTILYNLFLCFKFVWKFLLVLFADDCVEILACFPWTVKFVFYCDFLSNEFVEMWLYRMPTLANKMNLVCNRKRKRTISRERKRYHPLKKWKITSTGKQFWIIQPKTKVI